MDNVEIKIIESPVSGEKIEYVFIDRGNGEFTSMLKSVYDTLPSNSAE